MPGRFWSRGSEARDPAWYNESTLSCCRFFTEQELNFPRVSRKGSEHPRAYFFWIISQFLHFQALFLGCAASNGWASVAIMRVYYCVYFRQPSMCYMYIPISRIISRFLSLSHLYAHVHKHNAWVSLVVFLTVVVKFVLMFHKDCIL